MAKEVRKRLTPTKDTLRKLYLKSGNQCAFPGCSHLMMDSEGKFIGQICHIEAAEDGGERFNPNQTNEECRSFENLLLMCYEHHVETNDVEKYKVRDLQRIKADHEAKFTNAGDKLESAFQSQSNENNAQVTRIQFVTECMRPVTRLAFMLVLKDAIPASELGHFRIMADIKRIFDPSPWDSLYAAFRDEYMSSESQTEPETLIGVRGLIGSSKSPELFINRGEISRSTLIRVLRFNTALRNNTVYPTLGDMDGAGFDVFVTEPMLRHTHLIVLIVNNYAVIKIDEKQIVTAEQVGLTENNPPDCPAPLSEAEAAVPWKRIYLRSRDTDNKSLPPPMRHLARELHFDSALPERADIPPPKGARFMAEANWIME